MVAAWIVFWGNLMADNHFPDDLPDELVEAYARRIRRHTDVTNKATADRIRQLGEAYPHAGDVFQQLIDEALADLRQMPDTFEARFRQQVSPLPPAQDNPLETIQGAAIIVQPEANPTDTPASNTHQHVHYLHTAAEFTLLIAALISLVLTAPLWLIPLVLWLITRAHTLPSLPGNCGKVKHG